MISFSTWGEWMRHALELSATIAFTLSGVMTAARSRLDAVGVYAVAFLTALGGGTLRDILLDLRSSCQAAVGFSGPRARSAAASRARAPACAARP